MASGGLPDAASYEHPRLSWLIALAFDRVVRTLYRREELGAAESAARPGSLIVSNHLRDSDAPILAVTLCQRAGFRFRFALPFFATREDLFRRDALACLLEDWPRPASTLLASIPLGWLFASVRARPIRRLREFTFGETVEELDAAGLGEVAAEALFNRRGRRELAQALGRLPSRLREIDVGALGALRFSPWGLRRLRTDALRKLVPRARSAITGQLDGFAALLQQGHRVYFSPEGRISGDGRFGRVRDGVRCLCLRGPSPAPVVPVALSYDALGPGRLRVVVHVGAQIRALDASTPERFAADLRRSILRLCAVTPSHLIASFLCTRRDAFTTAELAEWLRDQAAAAGAAGATLDPLVSRLPAGALATRRLRWLRRQRLVAQDGPSWRNLWPPETLPDWRNPAGTVRYLANSFADLRSERAVPGADGCAASRSSVSST